MSNSRALTISAAIAGLAMLMVYSYVSDKEAEVKRAFGEEVVVLIAKQDIQGLQDIYPDMIEAVPVPKRFLQPGYITADEREALFITAKTVASTTILRGEQIVKTKLLFQGVETGVSGQVSIGKRAISIPVSEATAVNKLIKPGNRIDILSALTVREGTSQEIVVRNILQDVLVLATGAQIQNEIPRELLLDPVSQQPRVEDLRTKRAFTTITIELTPENAQKLIWTMASGGQNYVVLRNGNDRRVGETTSFKQENLLNK